MPVTVNIMSTKTVRRYQRGLTEAVNLKTTYNTMSKRIWTNNDLYNTTQSTKY